MRLLLPALVSLATLVPLAASGCGSPVCPDCFGGLELDLLVTDATMGQPIAGVTFTEAGAPLALTCRDGAADAGACGDWGTSTPDPGTHTVTVSAPGFASAEVSYTIAEPQACGCGSTTTVTVKLSPL
jgi:hypothetical protein